MLKWSGAHFLPLLIGWQITYSTYYGKGIIKLIYTYFVLCIYVTLGCLLTVTTVKSIKDDFYLLMSEPSP